jgi:hypothetical protein
LWPTKSNGGQKLLASKKRKSLTWSHLAKQKSVFLHRSLFLKVTKGATIPMGNGFNIEPKNQKVVSQSY